MLIRLFEILRYWLRSIRVRSTAEKELDEELEYHLERAVERNTAQGMDRRRARQEALRAMGPITQSKEECRDARYFHLLDDLAQDLRYAGRTCLKRPGFTTVIVLSLALGIGANTSVFSAIHALLLKQLAVREPERLVTFEQIHPDGSRQYNLSYPDFERLQGLDEIFSDMFATSWFDAYHVAGDGGRTDEKRARVSVVTGNYFSVLGLNARLGRTFTEEEDRAGSPVAVISDAYWDRLFDRSSDVIGRTLSMSGTTYTVVGVISRDFSGDWIGWPTDIWVPVATLPQVPQESRRSQPRGAGSQYKIVARLRAGVTLQQAQAAGTAYFRRMQEAPPSNTGVSKGARFSVAPAATGYSPQRDSLAEPLVILLLAAGCVLLIACANVANLLLARSAARHREIAVRLAIGAGRARIFRQLLTESILLGVMGSALGCLFAYWAGTALAAFAQSGPVETGLVAVTSVVLDARPDARVLAVTVLLGLLSGVGFGIAPAFRGSKTSLAPGLAARGTAGRAPNRFDFRKALVIAQVALSVGLLVETGLFVRTLRNLRSADVGFDPHRLLLVWTLPSYTGRRGPELTSLWQTTLSRVSSLPGVVSASASVEGLLPGDPTGGPAVRVEGSPLSSIADDRVRGTMTVGPRFFQTIGQPLLGGREFDDRDSDKSPPVAIVNESLARHFFGGADPIGRRLTIGAAPVQIVGMVRDARQNPRLPSGMMLYYPAGQNVRRLSRSMCLAIRTNAAALTLAARIRGELRAIDPRLAVAEIETMDQQRDRVLSRERLIATLSALFAVIAALLASIGLYGVVSFLVARRTNEIGVRLALGASRGRVARMILESSFLLLLPGLAAGVSLALGAGRLVRARLYGLSPADPISIAGAIGLMALVIALASLLPAYRAARVDPISALRYE